MIGWWNSGARKTFAAAAAAAARAPDLLLLVLYERHCFALGLDEQRYGWQVKVVQARR